jgi:peptide/nickel transport system permease protein
MSAIEFGQVPRRRLPGAARVAGRVLAAIGRERAFVLGVVLLLVLVFMGTVMRLIWTADPNATILSQTLAAPSLRHPMGTDSLGRDILARFDAGADISLLVGVTVATVGALIGGTIGVGAAVLGGWCDALLMRLMDALLSLPPLVMAMAVTVGLGPGVTTAIVGITIPAIPWYARVLRSEALRLRSLTYVEASLTMGSGKSRVVFRHVLPHLVSSVLIQGGITFSYGILAMAALGFVGLGAQPPTADWGDMISQGLAYALGGQWWISVFPGLGVLLATVGMGLLTDAGRDIFDPNTRVWR